MTRYYVIQHGRPDAMTIQNGRPDASQDGGQDVMIFKIADWLWRQNEQKTSREVIAPPPPILYYW